MDPTFWHTRWKNNEIAFHENDYNPILLQHFNHLSMKQADRIFIPLCGKTKDIQWLLSKGYRVVGAELSQIAIEQLFEESGLKPTISSMGPFQHYSAPNIEIYVGDIFNLTRDVLGAVHAIYDRAALVALPLDMRAQYTAHLTEITANAPQLLICYDYDQSAQAGPPFSVDNQEIERHYANAYKLTLLSSEDLAGGLKKKCPAKENVWLLKSK
jgi:thiopurine S-methyltransferase